MHRRHDSPQRRTPGTRAGRVTALAAGLAIVVAACGGDETTGDASPASVDAPPASVAPAPAPTDGASPSTSAAAPAATAAPGTTAASGNPAPAATTSPAAAFEVPDALRFSAALVGGGSIDAASLAGQPVLFWFWAPY